MAGATPGEAQAGARRLTEQLALALQGSLMVRHAPDAAADAFLTSRLGDDRTAQYGSLARGTDAAGILSRH